MNLLSAFFGLETGFCQFLSKSVANGENLAAFPKNLKFYVPFQLPKPGLNPAVNYFHLEFTRKTHLSERLLKLLHVHYNHLILSK